MYNILYIYFNLKYIIFGVEWSKEFSSKNDVVLHGTNNIEKQTLDSKLISEYFLVAGI